MLGKGYIPPVGFFYSVSLLGMNTLLSNQGAAVSNALGLDSAFQEVTGISAEIKTEEIDEGGENRFVYKVPSGKVEYPDLVLKRGVIVWGTTLSVWCSTLLREGLSKRVNPAMLIVQLLDTNSKAPIMAWTFNNAYPIKWEISPLDASKSEIVVETLTISYTDFTVVPGIGMTYQPFSPI